MTDPNAELGVRPAGFFEETPQSMASAFDAPPPAAATGDGPWPRDEAQLRDGRYEGSNPRLRVELRVDLAGSGVISGDLYRHEPFGDTYVASIRTAPGVHPAGSGPFEVIAEGSEGQTSLGTLKLTATGPERALAELNLDALLDGLAQGAPMALLCEWRSPHLRRLGLEVEIEGAVSPPPRVAIAGQPRSIPAALEQAGFEVYETGRSSSLPAAPAEGWSEKALENLMREYAESDLSRPGFELRLLWLSRSNRNGLLGVMFDSDDALPRQGLAVFAEEIRAHFGADADRKLIQTTVHEIGHALNLAHRFEREVGRADSTSFMNYDWRFRGGGSANDYWSAFSFTFDSDELSFLRHGGLRAVSPGGAAFHSVRYWADGDGGYSPYVPETPLPGFDLQLVPPPKGNLFSFGQPVILGIALKNEGRRPIEIPDFLLDPKAGFVELLVRRLDMADPEGGTRRAFIPIVDRCYDAVPERVVRLAPGEVFTDNVQLHFGAAGFPFAEPGFYDITALLVIYDKASQRDMICRSPSVRIRVAHPGMEEERDAFTMFSHSVGRWFALGGTLDAASNDAVQELAERRAFRVGVKRGRYQKAAADDPIVANVVRYNAFQAGRAYPGIRDGKIVEVRPAQPDLVRGFAEGLTDEALAFFDPVTAAQTRAFRDRTLAVVEPAWRERPGKE
jgi:hypothetical protein